MKATITRTDRQGLVEEPSIMRAQPVAPEALDPKAQIASELWNAVVREDVVAEVKARYERGEIDLSPERIARAILGE